MKIYIHYRKNLKLSKGKLASSCAHVGTALGMQLSNWYPMPEYYEPQTTTIIVLMSSDKKFEEHLAKAYEDNRNLVHVHKDKGLTEVEPDTTICFGVISYED